MKLRIKDDSLRFRLLRSEVDALAGAGRIEAHTLFSADNESDRLCYAVEHAGHYEAIAARHVGSEIRVTVPTHSVLEWARGATVGMYGEQQAHGGKILSIAIEKDFACIDGSDIDNTDTFENPNLQC